MKILQVISYFYPAWSFGGPGKLVYDLSTELSRKKNSVTVYTTDAFSKASRREKIGTHEYKNFTVSVFKNISNFLAFSYKLFLPLQSPNYIKEHLQNFDIIHIHEFFTFLSVLVSHQALKFNLLYIISAHGTLDRFNLKNRSFIKKIFMLIFGNKIIKNCNAFIAATEAEITEYIALGIPREKIYIVQNGIDFKEFRILPKKGNFRKKFRLTSGQKLILYLGRINKLKGLNILLNAFSELIKNIDCRLVIAGSDDGYLDEFKSEASKKNVLDKIIFPGIIAGREKLAAYVDCQIFMYPSPSEGFSIAVLEAAAAGLPLVLTKGCKFPAVAEKKAGIIVKSDAQEIKRALQKLLTSEVFRKNTSNNARKLIRGSFTISQMANKLLKIYKSPKN